jgi:putative membrane protein
LKLRLLLIAFTTALVPLSFIKAPYPNELLLQHMPTVLGVVLLAVATAKFRPTTLSFACLMAFLWLHILGARWIYSFVPYDAWYHSLAGSTLSERFGWERNHYDRFVHLASGVLGVPPAAELLQRWCGLRPAHAAWLSIAIVLSLGALYEILEWIIAISFSAAQADAYNGQQGDLWDPQKDLALALLGAIVTAMSVCRWKAK